jgi:pimeloyl-ACP methyl ester carboxylesterase
MDPEYWRIEENTSMAADDKTGSAAASVIQPQFVEIDGLQIRYARSEASSGETLVLLSPWPESILAFSPIWGALAAKFSLLAIDLPGFGRSAGRPDLLSPEPMGEFIVKLIGAFGLERPHVAGPDVGTPALLFAAANHPDAFSSIIVGSAAITYPLRITGALNLTVKAPTVKPFSYLNPVLFVNSSLASLENYRVPDFVREDYILSYAGFRFYESTAFVRAYPKSLPILQNKLATIQTPVQIIWGKKDQYVPVSNAEYLNEKLPNAKLDLLKPGHFVWEDAADDYARVVSDWVGGGYRQPRVAKP